ncbi:MAG: AAA family ATPase [Patescibacteria group bacterium]|nr:AAA family ATPase [Patescibacteria group bacterium]
MKEILYQFHQVILYGPPGTGKTRKAKRTALAILNGKEPAESATTAEIDKQLERFRKDSRFELVVFHPAYEYEQFVGGIEPTVSEGVLAFQVKAGIFLQLCRRAEQCPKESQERPVVLVIDEINRGNLPKLLGELVYALEYRDQAVTLPFVYKGQADLIVPGNLYILATMNSSDRSIGHIDVAIRRRFALCHVAPDSEVIRKVWRDAEDDGYGEQLVRLMEELNAMLNTGNDANAGAELGIGHSYFIPDPSASGEAARQQVHMKWEYQVQPLLREYAQLLNLGADSLGKWFCPLDEVLSKS